MSRARIFLMATSLGLGITFSVFGEKLIADSGSRHIPLLELYTSEGCSSCPPAERWVSSLKDSPDLWKTFVPVVFHVNYWDYLGWTDALSLEGMTERQHAISKLWNSNYVYTPAFSLDGKEWKTLSTRDLISNSTKPITLSIYDDGSSGFTVNIGAGAPSNAILHLVELGMGIDSNVGAGENSGRQLVHDFTVIGWSQKIIHASDRKIHFERPHQSNKYQNTRKAVAVWVEEVGRPQPLQSVGGFL
ncbi:MAG: hypothetical protein JWQ35_557 [Bacteriovoracaceae bacterium]|nr:hypothetical protein [Bacteriovoracaceae bacterium]